MFDFCTKYTTFSHPQERQFLITFKKKKKKTLQRVALAFSDGKNSV